MPSIAYLECTRCRAQIPAETPQGLCPQCAGVLFVRYDMAALRHSASREDIQARAATFPTSLGMWRYAAVLPAAEPVTLGEGFTPMLRSRRYPNLFLKEEAANPTGTFKARGLSMAVTMARHYGLKSSPSRPPAMPPAPWQPTQRPRALRPTSSCPAMFP